MPKTVKVVISEQDRYPDYQYVVSDNNLAVEIPEELEAKWRGAILNYANAQREMAQHFRRVSERAEKQRLESARAKIERRIGDLG